MFNKFGENYRIRNKLSFSLFFYFILFKHTLTSGLNWMYKKLKKMSKVYLKSE